MSINIPHKNIYHRTQHKHNDIFLLKHFVDIIHIPINIILIKKKYIKLTSPPPPTLLPTAQSHHQQQQKQHHQPLIILAPPPPHGHSEAGVVEAVEARLREGETAARVGQEAREVEDGNGWWRFCCLL